MVRSAAPQQPMEVHSGAQIHLQTMEDFMLEKVDVPDVTPWRAHDGPGSWPGPVAPWREEPRLEQVSWQDL
ncbi:hypothetical protein AV530_016854 [Patagioenas fasciata monilis]|uniref:Uncharacterized protein n=1 Tax=Patagioenas fasciata monilis TaxID=372326 RepID=A0A1V4J3T9_PATFA|nr:hypothetical protein AV530_016854 [Patagioenas fasciata monilis]